MHGMGNVSRSVHPSAVTIDVVAGQKAGDKTGGMNPPAYAFSYLLRNTLRIVHFVSDRCGLMGWRVTGMEKRLRRIHSWCQNALGLLHSPSFSSNVSPLVSGSRRIPG